MPCSLGCPWGAPLLPRPHTGPPAPPGRDRGAHPAARPYPTEGPEGEGGVPAGRGEKGGSPQAGTGLRPQGGGLSVPRGWRGEVWGKVLGMGTATPAHPGVP